MGYLHDKHGFPAFPSADIGIPQIRNAHWDALGTSYPRRCCSLLLPHFSLTSPSLLPYSMHHQRNPTRRAFSPNDFNRCVILHACSANLFCTCCNAPPDVVLPPQGLHRRTACAEDDRVYTCMYTHVCTYSTCLYVESILCIVQVHIYMYNTHIHTSVAPCTDVARQFGKTS